MPSADKFKRLARKIRGIPGSWELRPHTVTLTERSFSGTHTGDGTRTDTDLTLVEGNSQPPKVRWLSSEEMAVSGTDKSTVIVGPVTADFDARAWLDDIRGDNMATGDTRYLVITGPKHPSGAQYVIRKVTAERALHYMIEAQAVD